MKYAETDKDHHQEIYGAALDEDNDHVNGE
jgi:hypothetical protein